VDAFLERQHARLSERLETVLEEKAAQRRLRAKVGAAMLEPDPALDLGLEDGAALPPGRSGLAARAAKELPNLLDVLDYVRDEPREDVWGSDGEDPPLDWKGEEVPEALRGLRVRRQGLDFGSSWPSDEDYQQLPSPGESTESMPSVHACE
jgi:hypothetical protein